MMSDTGTSPELLLEQARAGNVEALGLLLELYRNYLGLLVRSHLKPALRARLDNSDLIQETFLHVHQGFPQFRGSSELELVAWLRRILARVLANQVKQHQRQARDHRREESLETLLDRSDQALKLALGATGSSPSGQAARREQTVLLADALARLTPDQNQVFMLRHFEHLPVEKIAKQMGRTVPAVRMVWTRAVKELNHMLKEPS
jgi:RNA polymerase sigma-70 factor (ECF subfamily)